jgi:predicted DNA-binding protein (MmcQ/YjbR family)
MPAEDPVPSLLAALPGSTEEYPFGPHVAVYKLGGKIFALVPVDASPPSISLKCEPEYAAGLRDIYDSIKPGYHLNKRHWNTITLDGSVPEDLVLDLVRHSYGLIMASLPKAWRSRYNPENEGAEPIETH